MTKPEAFITPVSRFIDSITEARGITFSHSDPEPRIRAQAAEITKAVRQKFPEYTVTEIINGSEYLPPFAVEWKIEPKTPGVSNATQRSK